MKLEDVEKEFEFDEKEVYKEAFALLEDYQYNPNEKPFYEDGPTIEDKDFIRDIQQTMRNQLACEWIILEDGKDYIEKRKFLFLRGSRLEQQLEQVLIEVSNYSRLRTNIERGFPDTKRRQHVTGPIQIQQLELIPEHSAKGGNSLLVRANANSVGKIYHPHIRFLRVGFQDGDLPNNVTFTGADGEEYHIMPIRLRMVNVEVACDCLDFYFRFSVHNRGDKSLYGPPPEPYHSRGLRAPVNPLKVPGVCKHLIKLVDALKNARLIIG